MRKKKKEFSKTLLIQESALIWILTIGFLVLAYISVINCYTGTLPWLTAMSSLPWAAYGVSQVWYYKKSTVENQKDGIKFESVMEEVRANFKTTECEIPSIDEIIAETKEDTTPIDLDYGI